MRHFILAALAAVQVAAWSGASLAQAAPQRATRTAQRASFDSSLLAAMKWREIGPYRGGRSVAVAGSSARPLEYWMGTTGGGVFKTVDAGISWTPVTDKYFGGTIGAIGVSESNPDIVYVGTGEFPVRGNVSHGDGVYKTTDGGKTWTHLGLTETRQISRVIVHPKIPDLIYVGAQGHVWAPHPDRGVFRSKDGGKTWEKVLFRNDSSGITDLEMDPSDPNVLYAAFWQVHRRPWKLESGGAGSGLFKSTDGGDSWTEITRNQGLPRGMWGNLGVAVSPKSSRVWAIIEADSGGVFRSDDGGRTWTKLNEDRRLRQRPWYYMRIYADTKDTNVVYVSNVAFWRSADGGKTFRQIRAPHGDSHDLWVAPNDAQRMIEGNDGGANVSFNGGRSWTEQDYATAQFYHVITTNEFPYHVCGAQQDNSTICGPSRSEGGVAFNDWYPVAGGESGYIAVKNDDPNITYGGSYGGYLTRFDRRTEHERSINPWPENPMGHSAGENKYRFQWTYPIMTSPHDSSVLYAAANVLFMSTNEGESWTIISPDLTKKDPATMGPSGGPITKDQTSVEYYATIFAMAESPVQKGVLWTGSDDGLIHVSRDGGKSWKNVTPRMLGQWTRISIIDPSPHDAGTAYVAANRFQMDDMAPYLYRTTDYGATWTRIDAGIARDQFTRVIRADPERRGLLYAGTERGVWVSFDDGASWQPLQRNLPPVPIHDMQVKEGDLVVATHGRSFWILDDLSPLRELSAEIAQKPAHLFQPRDVHRVNWGGGGPGSRSAHPTGQNPPAGAQVYFTLQEANQEVTLDFLDARGQVIQSFTSKQDSLAAADSVRADSVRRAREDSLRRAGADSAGRPQPTGMLEEDQPGGEGGGPPGGPPRRPRVPNKAGLNSFAWDLRYPDASTFRNIVLWAANTRGPMAPPGSYSVRLTVAGQAPQTQRFTLVKDPRGNATQADLEAQFALLIRIRDRVTEANDAVRTIRNVKFQLDDRKKQAGSAGSNTSGLVAAVDSLGRSLSAIEGEIYQVKNQSNQDPLNYPIKLNNKLASLGGVVASTDAKPTAQSHVVFDTLSARLSVQLQRLQQAMDTQLARINEMLRAANLDPIVPSTAEPAPPRREDIAAEEEEEGRERKW